MAVIGDIVVNASMDTSGIVAGTQKMRGLFAGVSARAAMFAGAVGGAVAGITGTAMNFALELPGRVVDQVMSAMDRLDDLSKRSKKLGIDANALAGIEHAADLSGDSIEDLEKAFAHMARTIVNKRSAFDKLGVAADGRPLDQVFLDVADAISRIEDPAERIAAAQSVFGRGGANLLDTLMAGRSGIEAAMKDSIALRGSYTAAQLSQVEAANDAITRTTVSLERLGNVLATDLAPAIEASAHAVALMVRGSMHIADMAIKLASVLGVDMGVADLDAFIAGFNQTNNVLNGAPANGAGAGGMFGDDGGMFGDDSKSKSRTHRPSIPTGAGRFSHDATSALVRGLTRNLTQPAERERDRNQRRIAQATERTARALDRPDHIVVIGAF